MRVALRTKILGIVGSTAIAYVASSAVSTLLTRHVHDNLTRIESRLIPRVALRPELDADFALLRRSYQDAVAAGDADALERTKEIYDRLALKASGATEVLDPPTATAFLIALGEYHDTAVDVSRRMIAGEGGEPMVERIALMQRRQARATELLAKLAAFNPGDLAEAFRATRDELDAGGRTHLVVSSASFFFALLLSFWLIRGMVRSFASLHAGFEAFGRGVFDAPIRVESSDELADIAARANRMAGDLSDFVATRKRVEWIKDGLVVLAKELRGELDVEELATRASRTVARLIGGPAAAIYVFESTGGIGTKLQLRGHHGLTTGAEEGDAPTSFDFGKGLVGEVARSKQTLVIDDPPPDYLRVRSGLGEATPGTIVLAPLLHGTELVGVLELALFTPLTDTKRELLDDAREIIAVALAGARSRREARDLLLRTQEQAARLLSQEEKLRSTNEELQTQQAELRQANEELNAHAMQVSQQRTSLEVQNTNLEALTRQLQDKALELTRVSSYKSEFLANMSHELRTPLNSMLLLSHLLADKAETNLTPKQIEYARTINSAGKELLLLINQVLDLAKVESGKQEIHLEPVRLEDVADRIRRVFAALAREKGLELTVDVAPGLPESIMTDGQRLGQILTNLVANAIKFTSRGVVNVRFVRPDPSVRFGIDTLTTESTVAFEVSDTGIGIAPEYLERVFSPFEQVDSSARRRHGGTGLGLSIAREFTTLLGGELRLASALGEGSTFVCYLPFERGRGAQRPNATLAASSVAPPTSAAAVGASHPSDLHLLVIEDDAIFAEGLGQLIRERGLMHLTATDGKTGLRLAREKRPRGIILDVRLPDIDGWRVMEELRADPATSSIPVHFVSALEMKERGLAMGAAGYLTKPVTPEDLIRVVESVSAIRPKVDRTSHKILVVEDDNATGEVLVEHLVAAGLEPRVVASARAALDLLEHEHFACVIVDPSVHDMRELELLESLREGASRPAVVVYTSRPLSRPEATRLEAYAEAVVLKQGASTDRLMDEIRLFVRRLQSGLPSRSIAPQPADVSVRLEGKKLLVVDDDMRTVYALSATLRAKGAEVLVADNGAEALEVLDAHPDAHAVLMDVMMPEMDGYEATRRIRAQLRFRTLPIIAITAKAMKGDEAKCIEAGATDYLSKPIDADALVSLIHVRIGGPDK